MYNENSILMLECGKVEKHQLDIIGNMDILKSIVMGTLKYLYGKAVNPDKMFRLFDSNFNGANLNISLDDLTQTLALDLLENLDKWAIVGGRIQGLDGYNPCACISHLLYINKRDTGKTTPLYITMEDGVEVSITDYIGLAQYSNYEDVLESDSVKGFFEYLRKYWDVKQYETLTDLLVLIIDLGYSKTGAWKYLGISPKKGRYLLDNAKISYDYYLQGNKGVGKTRK